MMKNKDKLIEVTIFGLLIVAIFWSILASALTLQIYLPDFTYEGDGIPHFDLMTEIDCITSSLNYALPIAICTMIFGVFLNIRNKQPIGFMWILAIIFLATLLPAIPLMIHFDRLHGESINIWANHVWWIPVKQ